MLATDNGR